MRSGYGQIRRRLWIPSPVGVDANQRGKAWSSALRSRFDLTDTTIEGETDIAEESRIGHAKAMMDIAGRQLVRTIQSSVLT